MMNKLLRGTVRVLLKPILHPRVPVQWQRRLLVPVGPTQPHVWGSSFEKIELAGVPARRIVAGEAGDTVILYLHGGAFVTGSPQSHRGLTSHMAASARATVFAADYRLAPEHPYPAAVDDALACYQALLEQGHTAHNLFIGGDSAGGNVALCAALAIRDRGLPMPAGLILISPFTDATQSGESTLTKAAIDPMIDPAWGKWAAKLYAGELPLDSPAISPLFADPKGLPRTLVQVGSDETLLDDSTRFADKARAAGVEVDLQVYEGLWHVFQLHTRLLKESMQAISRIADFIHQAPKQS